MLLTVRISQDIILENSKQIKQQQLKMPLHLLDTHFLLQNLPRWGQYNRFRSMIVGADSMYKFYGTHLISPTAVVVEVLQTPNYEQRKF